MKTLYIALFCLIQFFLHAETINYHVTRNDYAFSTFFDLASENTNFGTIVKSKFHIRTHYDIYDPSGFYEGQGICRIFTLGLFYTWATEIDIYDSSGNKVGMIDGQVISSEQAKFSIYDQDSNRICIAYLDQHCMNFELIDSSSGISVIARLSRNFIPDALDNWNVSLYRPDLLPPLYLKIFAAFACDTQDKFRHDH